MTREEQMKYCGVCAKRGFNPKKGVICSLTYDVATFSGTCPDFVVDEQEKQSEERKVTYARKVNNKSINRGRIALFIIGGLYVLVGLAEVFLIHRMMSYFGLIDVVVGLVFIGLGFLSYQRASLSFIIGLSIYVFLIVLLFAIEPTTLIRGIIWKGLVIFSLSYAIKTAREEEAKVKVVSEDLLDQI